MWWCKKQLAWELTRLSQNFQDRIRRIAFLPDLFKAILILGQLKQKQMSYGVSNLRSGSDDYYYENKRYITSSMHNSRLLIFISVFLLQRCPIKIGWNKRPLMQICCVERISRTICLFEVTAALNASSQLLIYHVPANSFSSKEMSIKKPINIIFALVRRTFM